MYLGQNCLPSRLHVLIQLLGSHSYQIEYYCFVASLPRIPGSKVLCSLYLSLSLLQMLLPLACRGLSSTQLICHILLMLSMFLPTYSIMDQIIYNLMNNLSMEEHMDKIHGFRSTDLAVHS